MICFLSHSSVTPGPDGQHQIGFINLGELFAFENQHVFLLTTGNTENTENFSLYILFIPCPAVPSVVHLSWFKVCFPASDSQYFYLLLRGLPGMVIFEQFSLGRQRCSEPIPGLQHIGRGNVIVLPDRDIHAPLVIPQHPMQNDYIKGIGKLVECFKFSNRSQFATGSSWVIMDCFPCLKFRQFQPIPGHIALVQALHGIKHHFTEGFLIIFRYQFIC